jgi:uncharacterized protein
MSVFVDTSALFALLDAEDAGFAATLPAWRRGLEEEVGFFTTNYVVLETVALAQRRLGLAAVRALCDEMLPMIETLWVTDADHESGLALLLLSGRRRLSLVDCVSFAIMRRHGLRDYLGSDPHFAEQGFTPYASAG